MSLASDGHGSPEAARILGRGSRAVERVARAKLARRVEVRIVQGLGADLKAKFEGEGGAPDRPRAITSHASETG